VSSGDTLLVQGRSADNRFTVNGDAFLNGKAVERWSHAQIMSGTATHTFATAGIHTCIVEIVYLGGASTVTMTFSIRRPNGSQHSIPKVCTFTGANVNELDDALVTINVK
jgi:hypothetical protein